jgi:hypothetical protein
MALGDKGKAPDTTPKSGVPAKGTKLTTNKGGGPPSSHHSSGSGATGPHRPPPPAGGRGRGSRELLDTPEAVEENIVLEPK